MYYSTYRNSVSELDKKINELKKRKEELEREAFLVEAGLEKLKLDRNKKVLEEDGFEVGGLAYCRFSDGGRIVKIAVVNDRWVGLRYRLASGRGWFKQIRHYRIGILNSMRAVEMIDMIPEEDRTKKLKELKIEDEVLEKLKEWGYFLLADLALNYKSLDKYEWLSGEEAEQLKSLFTKYDIRE